MLCLFSNLYVYIYKLANVVEGDLKAPFSIATTPRSKSGRHSIPWKYMCVSVCECVFVLCGQDCLRFTSDYCPQEKHESIYSSTLGILEGALGPTRAEWRLHSKSGTTKIRRYLKLRSTSSCCVTSANMYCTLSLLWTVLVSKRWDTCCMGKTGFVQDSTKHPWVTFYLFFSMRFVSVHEVHLYGSIDTVTIWKWPSRLGLQNTQIASLQRSNTLPIERPDMTLNHIMVRFQ